MEDVKKRKLDEDLVIKYIDSRDSLVLAYSTAEDVEKVLKELIEKVNEAKDKFEDLDAAERHEISTHFIIKTRLGHMLDDLKRISKEIEDIILRLDDFQYRTGQVFVKRLREVL